MSIQPRFFSITESVETGNLETDEKIAAQNFNFEKASFIRSTINQMEEERIAAQQKHYKQEISKYNQQNSKILEKKKKKIKSNYSEDLDIIKNEYQKKLAKLRKNQEKENQILRQKWDNARKKEAKNINFSIDNLLDISQLFAASGEYENAIQFRDTARAKIESERHPSIVKIDKKYALMFSEMSKRHEDEISHLIEELNYYIELRNEQRDIEESTAHNQYKIGETLATIQVVDTVLAANSNKNEARRVIEAFSPKKTPKKSPSFARNTSNSSKKQKGREITTFASISPSKYRSPPKRI